MQSQRAPRSRDNRHMKAEMFSAIDTGRVTMLTELSRLWNETDPKSEIFMIAKTKITNFKDVAMRRLVNKHQRFAGIYSPFFRVVSFAMRKD